MLFSARNRKLASNSKNHISLNEDVNVLKESKQGRMADALALGGDEGRDKLR